MLVLGILIGVAVAPVGQVGQVALAGSDDPAAKQAAPISTPEAVAAPLTGPQVYNAVCIACHAAPGVNALAAANEDAAGTLLPIDTRSPHKC